MLSPCALILPTRDGNFAITTLLTTPEIRFDPTYKGWKPGEVYGGRDHNNRFDPTYKGWKRNISFPDGKFIESFDPTYKGWKLNRFKGMVPDEVCFDPTYKGWKQLFPSK